MYKIGLTGGPGTGKTAALKLFKELGFKTFSSDELVKVIQKRGAVLTKIKKILGTEYITKNGQLKRKKLRKLIFENPSLKKKLERIIHPLVKAERLKIIMRLKGKKVKAAVFEVPLLIEAKLQNGFDLILLISSSREKQISRLIKREGPGRFTRKDALKMIKSQKPLSEKRRFSDYVIENNGSLRELDKKIKKFIKGLKLDDKGFKT